MVYSLLLPLTLPATASPLPATAAGHDCGVLGLDRHAALHDPRHHPAAASTAGTGQHVTGEAQAQGGTFLQPLLASKNNISNAFRP